MDATEMGRYKNAIEISSGNISAFLAQIGTHEDDFALVDRLAELIEEHAQEIRKAVEKATFLKTIGLFDVGRAPLSGKPDDVMNKFTAR